MSNREKANQVMIRWAEFLNKTIGLRGSGYRNRVACMVMVQLRVKEVGGQEE